MSIIAGVHTGKTGKGKAIEVSVEEKPYHAIKKDICNHAPDGESWWIDDVAIDGGVNVKPLNTPSIRRTRHKYSNNSYNAKGKVVIRKMNVVTGKLHKKFTKKFNIEFKDMLDDQGLPDFKIIKLILS